MPFAKSRSVVPSISMMRAQSSAPFGSSGELVETLSPLRAVGVSVLGPSLRPHLGRRAGTGVICSRLLAVAPRSREAGPFSNFFAGVLMGSPFQFGGLRQEQM